MLGIATDSTTVTLEETRIISGASIIVYGVTVENNGALGAIEVVFTNTAGTEILSIAVPANKTFHYKPSWVAEDGLRIIGLYDSGVKVTVKHNDDIAPLAPADAVADPKALDFATNETLLNSSDNPIGIGNEWSIQINTKPLSATINMFILRIQPVAGNANQIVINLKGSSANDPIGMQILRTSGAAFKDYDWNNTFTSGTKVSYVFTWDGTSLLLYVDGVLTEADTKTSDYTASMSATDRRVSVGSTMGSVSYTGTIHSTSIWDVVLTQAEVTALQNGGSPEDFDNGSDSGGYAQSANLQHYWRHGFDASDFGRDYGNASTLIDIGDDALNLTAADIVTY